MTATRAAAALVALGAALAAPAAGAIAFPGDTWGRVSHDLNIDTGTGVSWFVNQGIDWYELPGGITVNTFGEYRHSRRSKDRTYFDASGPAVGLDFRRAPFRAGVERFWETLPEQDDERVATTRAYFTWYQDWYKYLRRRLVTNESWYNPVAYSGNTWGRVRREFDNLESTTVSFYVNQGIDWIELPGGITYNTFVEARFSYRSKDADYYNALGPAIGMELQRTPFKLGTDYYWERFTEREVTQRTWRLYLTWYYNWDLKNIKFGDE